MAIGYLFRAVLASVTALPADVVVNDYSFVWLGGGAPAVGDFENAKANIVNFYNSDHGTSADAVSEYIGTEISRGANASMVQAYSVPDTEGPLGSPDYEATWTLGPGTASAYSLPAEVAVCLSFNADLTDIPEESGTTRPRARRRGRVYIGPMSSKAFNNGVGVADVQRVSTNCRDVLCDAAADELGAAMAADSWDWSVFSRADWLMRPVVGGFVENAFDTQRRRGTAATTRTTFTV